MRHRKHNNQLGVKKEHRHALMANLASALIEHGRIETTLKKAKALRPFVERLVTLAKKGGLANRRLAASRLRNEGAVQTLFDERVEEFRERSGGYTRIYKLGARRGDAAEMAIIEWVGAGDQGHGKRRRKRGGKAKAAAESAASAVGETAAGEQAADRKEETAAAETATEEKPDEAAVEEKTEAVADEKSEDDKAEAAAAGEESAAGKAKATSKKKDDDKSESKKKEE